MRFARQEKDHGEFIDGKGQLQVRKTLGEDAGKYIRASSSG
jgi:hypothetical protein